MSVSQSTVEKIKKLPFVKSIRTEDRPDCTHIVDTGRSTIRLSDEIATLQAHGVTDCAISKWGDYGLRLFVTIE